MEHIERYNLVKCIRAFLDAYAVLMPNPEDEFDYNGPDSLELYVFAKRLENGVNLSDIDYPFSEWSSGCYKPYNSKFGRNWHDFILKEISSLKKHD